MINTTEKIIQDELTKSSVITDAILYGSFLYGENFVDCDIAVFIDSYGSTLNKSDFIYLYSLRESLTEKTGVDVDLIPHTHDELSNSLLTPIWFPRYNPSLVFGKTLKGSIKIEKPNLLDISYSNLALYVILDTRTIIRRQICRISTHQESNIFFSKIIHLCGNITTLIKNILKEDYLFPPSDIMSSAKYVDSIIKDINAVEAVKFISSARLGLSKIENPIILDISMLEAISWYEKTVYELQKHLNNMGSSTF